MSKLAAESVLSKINTLLGVDESYKAPAKVMEIISDAESAKTMFLKFSEAFNYDFSYEWFNQYFEDEHADRKNNKQDFTPTSISDLISEMQGRQPQYGVIYEPAAGTGSTIISHWHKETRKHRFPWDYRPSNYCYLCEELSDKTIPFLLFNLLIRGMNAVVIHGNTLTREAKEVYLCCNEEDDFMCYSKLNVAPHTEKVEKYFNVKFIK